MGGSWICGRQEDFANSIIDIGTLQTACFDDAHGIAEKFLTAVAAKTNSLFLFPLIFAKCSFREVI